MLKLLSMLLCTCIALYAADTDGGKKVPSAHAITAALTAVDSPHILPNTSTGSPMTVRSFIQSPPHKIGTPGFVCGSPVETLISSTPPPSPHLTNRAKRKPNNEEKNASESSDEFDEDYAQLVLSEDVFSMSDNE